MAVLLLYFLTLFIFIQYIIPLVLNTVSKVLNDLYSDSQHKIKFYVLLVTGIILITIVNYLNYLFELDMNTLLNKEVSKYLNTIIKVLFDLINSK